MNMLKIQFGMNSPQDRPVSQLYGQTNSFQMLVQHLLHLLKIGRTQSSMF